MNSAVETFLPSLRLLMQAVTVPLPHRTVLVPEVVDLNLPWGREAVPLDPSHVEPRTGAYLSYVLSDLMPPLLRAKFLKRLLMPEPPRRKKSYSHPSGYSTKHTSRSTR